MRAHKARLGEVEAEACGAREVLRRRNGRRGLEGPRRVLREGRNRAKKLKEGQESYCAKLNDLFLVIVFATVGDTRKIITLFPTNRRATLERFC